MKKKYDYDAIVVLGAVMEWNEESQKWTFPDIVETYKGKLVIGRLRALAASKIHESSLKILVTGGSNKHPKTKKFSSRAEELSKIIINYGVPREKVIVIGEKRSSNTIGNIENIIKYLENNSNIKNIAIVCPEFQMERAKLMFGANFFFKKNSIEITWLEVFGILKEEDNYNFWRDYENDLYSTEASKINGKLEKKGINDFINGSYKTKN